MEENNVVVEQKKRNGKGLASFILGAIGVIIPIAMIIFISDKGHWDLTANDRFFIYEGIAMGFILFAVGMVFGILGSLKSPRGFAITGIVLSSIALVASYVAVKVLDFVDMGRAFLLF